MENSENLNTEVVVETPIDVQNYHLNVMTFGIVGISLIGFIAGLFIAKMLWERVRGVK